MNRLRFSLLPFTFLLTIALCACGSLTSQGTKRPRSTPAPEQKSTSLSVAAPLPGSYAALGASETYGVGAAPITRGYAYEVAHSLHARQFRDQGIPGATLGNADETELIGALPIRPSLCTVFFGFNDLRAGVTRKAFMQNLHDFVVTLHRAGSRVLIIGLPDISLLPAVHSLFPDLHRTVASWNGGMRHVARDTGSNFLDLRAFDAELVTHPNYIASDGLHPSNLGHARLAAVILRAIRQNRLWAGG
ncbi:MAG: hypothetical protein NVSMB52_16700 [Chloroflexota bacterium]